MSEPYVKGAGAGRKQVPLKKGFSLMNWVDKTNRLGSKLAGLGGKRPAPVTAEELAKHCADDDLWMALNGKVYNVTPYVPYHPGGVAELMRAAGADGTQLFHELHPWVNIERFLGKCYVGPLAVGGVASSSLLVPGGQPRGQRKSSPLSRSAGPAQKMQRVPNLPGPGPSRAAPGGGAVSGAAAAAGAAESHSALQLPRRSFYQTQDTAVIVLYGLELDADADGGVDVAGRVAVVADKSLVHITVATSRGQYRLQMALPGEVEPGAEVEHRAAEGKLLVKLTKRAESVGHWPTLGEALSERHDGARSSSRGPQPCTLVASRKLTHNSAVYSLLPPDADGSWECKLGQHIQVRLPPSPDGRPAAVRSYTPVSYRPAIGAGRGHGDLLGEIFDDAPPGGFQLLVKLYREGAVSPHIASLALGDTLLCHKPIGAAGPTIEGLDALCMVAAGTGIAPMVPYIDVARRLAVPAHLVFCNSSEEDILLRDQLDAAERAGGLVVTNVISRPSDAWGGVKYRVKQEVLETRLPRPGPRVLVLVCGPIEFCRDVSRMLTAIGHRVHAFF